MAAGLYDVTPGAGQSGNFMVDGTNSYNEILGSSSDGLSGVPKVRVMISSGDSIKVSGLSQVVFTPVTTPLVTTHTLVNLYAGTWTVGQDIGPGTVCRHNRTPGERETSSVEAEDVNEILGTSGDGL